MTQERRIEILEFVDNYFKLPESCTEEDTRELLDGGFMEEDEESPGKFYLTSLGELEVGYPETDNSGDIE